MFRIWFRVFISPKRGIALGVMWKPILVGVDSDQILETESDSSLLVSLQLRKIEKNITPNGRARKQVFVTTVYMMPVDFAAVVVGSVIAAATLMSNKFASIP